MTPTTSGPAAHLDWRLLALACATALPLAAAAQDAVATHTPAPMAQNEPYKVVITAQRTPQRLADVLADVTILEREQIERSGAVNIVGLLRQQRGLEIYQNGGPGTVTGVFVRGAESRYTAVYIDGVRVDAQTTQGGPPWDAISLSQVDRVEILRGPAASVYGSDAVAGVIQIFTRRATGPFTPYVGIGAGTRRGWKTETGFSGTQGIVDYALGVAREGSRGFNAMPASNPDRDGYRQTSASARLGLQFNPDGRLDLNGSWNRIDADYDSEPAFDSDALTREDRGISRLGTLGATWSQHWSGSYSTRLSVTQSGYRYASITPPFTYLAKTRLRNYLLQNEWRAGPHVWSADLERREDHLATDPVHRGRHQNALALGYGYSQGRHTVQLNVRHDRDSDFGGQTTGSAAYGLAFAEGWRATASAGTAFRVPTLYQRFSEYGSDALEPEKSLNVEVGLHWAKERRAVDLVAYQNRVRNLIEFGAPAACGSIWGCYENAGSARMRGVTLSGQHDFGPVELGAAVELQRPVSRDTGKLLVRRARQQLKLNANTRAGEWTLGGEWQLASHRWDDAANTVRLAGYGIVNLYASRTLARDWNLLLRVDNALNRHYELAGGYAAQPLRAFAQLRWTPR